MSYNVSDTCGGVFGRMGEKREEKKVRGVGERRHYNSRLIGSAFGGTRENADQ